MEQVIVINPGNHLDDFWEWLKQGEKLIKTLEKSGQKRRFSFQTDKKFDSNAVATLVRDESIFVHSTENDSDHYRDKRLNDWKSARYVEI